MSAIDTEPLNNDAKKSMAQPPLNILFNPSLLVRRDNDIWSINVVELLELFLRILSNSGNKDLRICGIAAVSSSLIYRLKVESIFALEKIAMQRKAPEDPNAILPVPQLNTIELPFRFESTYPVTVNELLQVLEHMIMDLASPKPRKKQVELEPVENFDFDQYLLKFEQLIKSYEDMIFDIVSADGSLMFKSLVAKMDSVEAARCFIAILHLAMKGKVDLQQQAESNDDDILILLSCNNSSRITAKNNDS